MALFGKKKTEEKVAPKAKVEKKVAKVAKVKKDVAVVAQDLSAIKSTNNINVIIRPHITEKSGYMSEKNVYTFEVMKDANKNTVSQSIMSLYKVNPVKIAIINLPEKKVIHRGKKGYASATKKAVVTLKTGDKIEFL